MSTQDPFDNALTMGNLITQLTSYLSKYRDETEVCIEDYACTSYHGNEGGIELRFVDPIDFTFSTDELLEEITLILEPYKKVVWYNVAAMEDADRELFEDEAEEEEAHALNEPNFNPDPSAFDL